MVQWRLNSLVPCVDGPISGARFELFEMFTLMAGYYSLLKSLVFHGGMLGWFHSKAFLVCFFAKRVCILNSCRCSISPLPLWWRFPLGGLAPKWKEDWRIVTTNGSSLMATDPTWRCHTQVGVASNHWTDERFVVLKLQGSRISIVFFTRRGPLAMSLETFGQHDLWRCWWCLWVVVFQVGWQCCRRPKSLWRTLVSFCLARTGQKTGSSSISLCLVFSACHYFSGISRPVDSKARGQVRRAWSQGCQGNFGDFFCICWNFLLV